MKKFICRLIGHNWHEHSWWTEGSLRYSSSTPFCVCSRCGKTGWLL